MTNNKNINKKKQKIKMKMNFQPASHNLVLFNSPADQQ